MLFAAVTIAVIGGLLRPFSNRLHATGLWLGRVLAPPSMATAQPTGLQDALTHGWPSSVSFVSTLAPFIAGGLAATFKWWAAPLVFVLPIIVGGISDPWPLVPKALDRYIAILHSHLVRRQAGYARKGDAMRAEAAASLASEVSEVLRLYLSSGVPAPRWSEAQRAPFGEPGDLILKYGQNRGTTAAA